MTHGMKPISPRFNKNKLKVITICVLLCLASLLTVVETRWVSFGRAKIFSPRQTSVLYNDLYQNSKPLSWGLLEDSNLISNSISSYPRYSMPLEKSTAYSGREATSAVKSRYPMQQQHNVLQTHKEEPLPYSVNQHRGPPPPYSAANNPNLNSPFNQPPSTYSAGTQLGGTGYPRGKFQGGGVAPSVNYAPAPSFPIDAIPVGAYKQQSSGVCLTGLASGVLAGAAGAAIYTALKPEDRVIYRDRVTVVNANPEHGKNAATVASAPAAPIAGNATNSPASALVTMNATSPPSQYNKTNSVPAGKQYYPPPGQYYPATGQYVPPGEYDPVTKVFAPGRYIPGTNIFQQGQYNPLTQIFTPGSYDPAGQFVPDPSQGAVNMGALDGPHATTSTTTSQPLNQSPQEVNGSIIAPVADE